MSSLYPQRSLRGYLGIAFRGLCMGAADIVPGVSGGTIAFISGIYEELIDSIRALAQPPFWQAVRQQRWRDALSAINFWFLLALSLGILTAILTLSRGLEYLLENEPVLIWSFFFGLVLASVVTVSRRIQHWTPTLVAGLLLGGVGAYILVGLVPVQTPNTWWFLILSGAIAICAMILPGVSGAFLLVLLGKYQFVLSAVNDRDIGVVALVAVGAVVGLLAFSQVLGALFHRYHDTTVAVLTGLMLGSLRKVWPWKEDVAWLQDATGEWVLNSEGHRIVVEQHNLIPTWGAADQVFLAILLALIGVALVLVLEWLANRMQLR